MQDMTERKFALALGEYFHVYNRGNSKQKIFLHPSDYRRFVTLLYVSNATESFKLHLIDDPYRDFKRGEQLVSIGAYCLMPNHFHLLLTPLVENGISQFMKKVSTGYSMYFNKKYERSGALFEGRFKAQHAANDAYLKYLFSYIHLNPIKLIQHDWKEVGIQNSSTALTYLEKYAYSSFSDYDGDERKESVIIDKGRFPQYFSSREHFREEIVDWITIPV